MIVIGALSASTWLMLDTRNELRAAREDIDDVRAALAGVEDSLGQSGSTYLEPQSVVERIDDVESRIEDLHLKLDALCLELNVFCE